MAKLLYSFLSLLASSFAYAQSSGAEPAEKASPVVMIIFLVLFIGSIVAFAAYTWWNGRKKAHEKSE